MDCVEEEIEIENADHLREEINNLVERYIRKMKSVSPKEIGLDTRAGHSLLIDETALVSPVSCRGSMNYYGGFEYIDKSHLCTMGDYDFWYRENSHHESDGRIGACIDRIFGSEEEEFDVDSWIAEGERSSNEIDLA